MHFIGENDLGEYILIPKGCLMNFGVSMDDLGSSKDFSNCILIKKASSKLRFFISSLMKSDLKEFVGKKEKKMRIVDLNLELLYFIGELK